MDQLQLHLRLLKVLSSLSVTPNLSDYAWQLNYVILYDKYCYFVWFTSFSLSRPLPMIWSRRISWTLFNKKYICYTVQKVCPRPFSSPDHTFPKKYLTCCWSCPRHYSNGLWPSSRREQSSTRILDPGNSHQSQPHFFSLGHEKWFSEVSRKLSYDNLDLVQPGESKKNNSRSYLEKLHLLSRVRF